jgi:transcriptional antiterminator NusG
MPEHEVKTMLTGERAVDPNKKAAKIKLDFEKGDRVRIRDGSFANQEGEVKAISEPKDPTDSPKVKVELTFWGRPLEVELEYYQVDKV